MKTIAAKSPIFIDNPTVGVRFDITFEGREWDVTGFVNIRDKQFTPVTIGSFSVSQFASDVAKAPVSDVCAKLQSIVKKGLK